MDYCVDADIGTAVANAAYQAVKDGVSLEELQTWNLPAWGITPENLYRQARSAMSEFDKQQILDSENRDAA